MQASYLKASSVIAPPKGKDPICHGADVLFKKMLEVL